MHENFSTKNNYNVIKRFLTVFLTAFFITFSLVCTAQSEKGVSLALAKERAACISDVHYQLFFNIPSKKEEKVLGTNTISFNFKGNSDLIIDFQGDSSQVNGKCLVNGKAFFASLHDEHITIPQKQLQRGKNTIKISFTSGDKPLNRNVDYMYTLFVPDHARQVFPCFDQPDLKARFSLSLCVPNEWKAISTGQIDSTRIIQNNDGSSSKILKFSETELLPTYLFSFTAGKFNERIVMRDGRTMRALYRENDSAKVAQLDKIFDIAAFSLRWLENYTGIKMPFRNYGFVVIPSYQFGGMEHPGAIQFNDKTIFLSKNPTPDEELKRFELIAHETSHLWFGDLVTMRWFNDVWTKEVFANYMAAKMSREQFPNVNHDLNFLKMYQTRAIATDRTEGTTPIQQPLSNLNRASLLYGNIIYDKAPVVMRKLEQFIGSKAFHNGLKEYLHKFSYANATWDDLINCLKQCQGSNAPDVVKFSDVWVKKKGMPTIEINPHLIVTQKDPLGRGLVWPQKFNMQTRTIVDDMPGYYCICLDANIDKDIVKIPSDLTMLTIIPNYDGSGYGRFLINQRSIDYMEQALDTLKDINRFSAICTLYENYLMHKTDSAKLIKSFMKCLAAERNPLIASTLCDYLWKIVHDSAIQQHNEANAVTDADFYRMSKYHALPSLRQRLTRLLFSYATEKDVIDSIYNIWKNQNDSLMNERDYMDAAYHLAIMRPNEWKDIVNEQRTRLKDNDKIREFDFISRACNPDTDIQQQVFNSLLIKDNRANEPWAAQMLALLNCETREPISNRYITPALDVLEEIQKTGDIFFPTNWLNALFEGHKSHEAQTLVRSFIDNHPNYDEPLMNKLKEAAYFLLNE